MSQIIFIVHYELFSCDISAVGASNTAVHLQSTIANTEVASLTVLDFFFTFYPAFLPVTR